MLVLSSNLTSGVRYVKIYDFRLTLTFKITNNITRDVRGSQMLGIVLSYIFIIWFQINTLQFLL